MSRRAEFRRWSRADDAHLQALAGRRTNAEIAASLGRTVGAIDQRLRLYPELQGLTTPPTRGRSPWSEADDARLGELLAAGKTYAEVARLLHRTPSAIASRVWVLRGRQSAGRDWAALQQAYDAGASITQIMKDFKISYYALVRGIQTNSRTDKRPLDDEEIDLIEEKYLNGCTIKCIMRSTGRGEKTIISAISERKLKERMSEKLCDAIDICEILENENLSARAIAEKLEIPLDRASRILAIHRELSEGDENER